MTPLHASAFLLFVLSGFCGLVYQIVWLRLAFAAFGVVTPVLSVVLSAFMAGLALGSWLGGRVGARLSTPGHRGGATAYGLVEWGIAVGAFAVPALFAAGEAALLHAGEHSSAGYMAISAVILALPILAFATLMGTTFPLMMAFLRASRPADAGTFSFLYLGNVIGAMLGSAVTAVALVELLGFRATLGVAAAGNALIGLAAIVLLPRLRGGTRQPGDPAPATAPAPAARPQTAPPDAPSARRLRSALLFATGLTSMAMEVAWTRAFTPVLETTIYAFAGVLTVYLAATWIGSAVYRRHLAAGRPAGVTTLLALLFPASLLPLLLNDPGLGSSAVTVLTSIVPISALLGYLTPQLVDQQSSGDARVAGAAYALNVLGCILGPLLAGYVLLPTVGVGATLLANALVFPCFLIAARQRLAGPVQVGAVGCGIVAAGLCAFVVRTHEDSSVYTQGEVRRDHVASVVSFVEPDDPVRPRPLEQRKRLLVNGVGITTLTDLTKVMAHLPLVVRPTPPESTLVICFGMGTTFRSLISWGGRATAVELVPSVVDAFGFYFDDARQVLMHPGARIVVDDGRRFLRRTTERFDLITIDPPPPAEAAGSSLLYSREFVRLARQRLSPTGLLHHWFPGGEDAILRAIVNTIAHEFPHVVAFKSFESHGDMRPADAGIHILAAEWPIEPPGIAEAIRRMPEAARRDLLEWHPELPIEAAWDYILRNRVELQAVLPEPGQRRLGITDDRPFNEYFLLRRSFGLQGRLSADALPE